MKESLTRRGFLAGATALAGSAALVETGCRSMTGPGERFAVFLSDLHVRAGKSYQRDRLEKTVNEMLVKVLLSADHRHISSDWFSHKPLRSGKLYLRHAPNIHPFPRQEDSPSGN